MSLLLRFTINLQDQSVDPPFNHPGPLFHRWLPNGRTDAIIKDIPEHDAHIELWFERCGFIESGMVEYSETRKETLTDDIITKQGVLVGGHLQGSLSIHNLSDNDISVIKSQKINDKSLVSLCKKIVKDLIYPNISSFIKILRNHYGQYWINEIPEWDSREQSLGYYCYSILNLEWLIDDGTCSKWKSFIPNDCTAHLASGTVSMITDDLKNNITQSDWKLIGKYFQDGYFPSFASDILGRAHKYLDQGHYRQAFIEAVTAFELGLSLSLKELFGASPKIEKAINNFLNTTLDSQLTIVSIHMRVDTTDIEKAIEAIGIRNKVVHEGYNPFSSEKDKLQALLNITSRIISGPGVKFPTINPGNAIMPPEDWDRL